MQRRVTPNTCHATCGQFASTTLDFLRGEVPKNRGSFRELSHRQFPRHQPKGFLGSDVNRVYLIFRHFHIGIQMRKFLADNVAGVDAKSHPLKPRTIDDFRDNTMCSMI